jgi:undecaprenyl-diphosphatase
MNGIQAFILGAVQGLTEFLPVSSSGHLVLFQNIFGLRENVLTFDIAVHLATMMAVIAVFRKDVLEILKRPLGKMTWLLAAGTLPAVLVGLTLKKSVESIFEGGKTLGLEFIATGIVLWLVESVRNGSKQLDRTSAADALLIGAAQAVAILPAVSRSGLTIACALFRGLNREFAAKFSFLLSIPAILGATVLDLPDAVAEVQATGTVGVPTVSLVVGMAAALVFGFIAIRWMLRVLTKGSLRGFAVYVIILGLLVLIDQLFFGKWFTLLL